MKQNFTLQIKLFKFVVILLVVFSLVVTPVSSSLGPMAMSFVKSSVLKTLPPEMAQAYGYLIDPTGSLQGAALGQLQKIAPDLTKGISLATQPEEALKGKILEEVNKQLDPKTLNIIGNIQQYAGYAEKVLEANMNAPPGQEYGNFDCDKQTKRCLILKPDGTKFMDLPESFKVDFNEKENTLTVTNTGEKQDNLKIGDFNIGNLGKGGSIKFKKDESGTNLEINGESDVLVGGKSFFKGVKDAKFRFSEGEEGQIEFAEFIATKPSSYGFTYKFSSGNVKTYNFKTTKPDSKVEFNSGEEYVNPFINAENVNFDFGDQLINGEKVTLNFNDDGNIEGVLLDGANAKYVDKKKKIEVGSNTGDPIFVFFNKKGRTTHSSVTLMESKDAITITSSGGAAYYKLNNMKVIDAGYLEDESTNFFYDKKKNKAYLNCKVSCDVTKGNTEYFLDRDDEGKMQVSMTMESLKKKRLRDKDTLFLEVEDGKFAEVDNKGDFAIKSSEGTVETFEEETLKQRVADAKENSVEDAFGKVSKQKETKLGREAMKLAKLSERPTVDCSFRGKGQVERSILNPASGNEKLSVDNSLFGKIDCMQSRRKMKDLNYIIIHDGGKWKGNNPAGSLVNFWLSRFVDGGSGTSSHYFIDKNGIVYPLMEENFAGSHAACSSQNVNCIISGVNSFSIGIDLHYDLKSGGYTDETMHSLNFLLRDISQRRGIPYDDEHIKGHYEVYALHSDPIKGFKWENLGLNPGAHQRFTRGDILAMSEGERVVLA